MKILMRQFLSQLHSWSVVGWGIANALIAQGHQVDLFSTDGTKHLPKNLQPNLIGYTELNKPQLFGKMPDQEYDCQISYTAMKNFPLYLSNGSKNRFGIWCYEWSGQNVLPTGFAKHYKSCDSLLAPSVFAKKVFMDSGIPESAIKVITHGINVDQYKQKTTIELKTNKKFKILANIAQNHLRKNIPGLLEAYGQAFTSGDDVCLILKGSPKPAESPFEVNLNDCLKAFYQKFPRHAEIKIFSDFLEDISILYRSVDCTFTMTHCEAFYFPALESICSGKLAISPNWGGQIDFLDESNSLLISGKEVRANPKSMYWEAKPNATWFQPSIEDAVDKLQYAYKNYEQLNAKIVNNVGEYHKKYDWKTVSKEIIDLCK